MINDPWKVNITSGGNMSLLNKARLLTEASENARAAGGTAVSIELAIEAAKYLQLVRLLN